MANRDQFNLSKKERQSRIFSESFKKSKVRELEIGLIRPAELKKVYQVSYTSIYRWIAKYGSMKDKKERLIVENQSDSAQILSLKKKVADLERVIGQKQLLLDFQQKMIELAEEEYQVDIKKKFSGEPSTTTGSKEK
ncbi:MAG: hypothetical protein ACFCUU_00125 [Cyclobacteriaceae bacterium]